MTTPNTFTDEFRARIKKIENDAKAIGMNWTKICKTAGISRATPDRWLKNTPTTVALVDTLERIVEAKKREAFASLNPGQPVN